jgi:hypothetical protein
MGNNELREKTIKDIEGFFEKKSSSIECVCFFMHKIRLLLEIDNSKGKYKILNHYCNWLFHKNLDKGLSPEIIDEISASFENFQTKNDFIKKVNNSLSIIKFVVELKEVLYLNIDFKYEYVFVSDDFWVKFTEIILNEIKNRPIILMNKKEIMSKKINDFDFSIYGIQLSTQKGKIVIEVLSNDLANLNKQMYIDFEILK